MAFDAKIGGAGGAGTGAAEASTWLDLNGLAQLKAGANDGRSRETLKAVAQQFESLFLGMMLKSMRDAKLGESPFESDETRFYQDMFDKQISLSLSQGRGLGIADMLVQQLGPRLGLEAASGATPGAVATPAAGATPGALPIAGRAALPLAAEAAARAYAVPARGATPWLPTTTTTALAMQIAGGAPELPAGAFADGIAALGVGDPFGMPTLPMPEVGAGAAPAVGGDAFATSAEDFVRKVMPHAERAAAQLGTDPRVLVAQAALETGWGRRVPATPDGAGYNLFGVKAGGAWEGRQLLRDTLEVENGVPVRTRAAFRAYDSLDAGFGDYVSLLRNNGRYAGVLAAGRDPAGYAAALQSAGYATDPDYARKIVAIVDGDTLRGAVAALKDDGRVPTP